MVDPNPQAGLGCVFTRWLERAAPSQTSPPSEFLIALSPGRLAWQNNYSWEVSIDHGIVVRDGVLDGALAEATPGDVVVALSSGSFEGMSARLVKALRRLAGGHALEKRPG